MASDEWDGDEKEEDEDKEGESVREGGDEVETAEAMLSSAASVSSEHATSASECSERQAERESMDGKSMYRAIVTKCRNQVSLHTLSDAHDPANDCRARRKETQSRSASTSASMIQTAVRVLYLMPPAVPQRRRACDRSET